MAKPAEHRAPSTRMGNVRPNSTAVLVGSKWMVRPLWPSEIRPKFAGGGMGGGGGAGPGAGKAEGEGGDDDEDIPITDKNHGMLSGRLKKLEAKMSRQFKAELTAALTPLNESFTKFSEKLEAIGTGGQGGAGGKDGAGKGDGGIDIENHPVVKGLQKKNEEFQKKWELAEQKSKDTEAAARRSERDRLKHENVMTRLAGAGIEGIRAEDALIALTRQRPDGRVLIDWDADDSDDLVFHGKTKGEPTVDLDSGFGDWLKTDHAKLYLPPRGAIGSGGSGGGRAPGAGKSGKLQAGDLGKAILRAANQLPFEPE